MGRIVPRAKKKRMISLAKIVRAPIWAAFRKFGGKRAAVGQRRIDVPNMKHWRRNRMQA